MKNLTIILEKQDDEIWGRVDAPGFLYTTSGETVEEITANMRELIGDYLNHEGKDSVEWAGISINDITFDYAYDLTAFFELFDDLKIGSIAARSGINKALMRQYASGVKHPSSQQAKKIEEAVHELGKILQEITFA